MTPSDSTSLLSPVSPKQDVINENDDEINVLNEEEEYHLLENGK
jgi:hypothetical protein